MSARFLAERFLWPPRRYLFTRFLTIVAVGSVAVSVASMVLVLSVMSGFRTQLERKLLGFTPHVTVRMEDAEETVAASRLAGLVPGATIFPWVEGEAILQDPEDGGAADQGVKVIGVPPAIFAVWPSVARHTIGSTAPEAGTGRRAVAEEVPQRGERGEAPEAGIFLGSELIAERASAAAFVRLVAPLGLLGPSGELAPSVREARVAGWLRTGLYEYDRKLVVMTPDEAYRLLGEQAMRQWALYLPDPMRTAEVRTRLAATLGEGARITTWQEQNRTLFGALRLERIMMRSLLVLMIGIASVCICGALCMHVAWRRCDLGILAAIGAASGFRQRIVLLLGAAIGLIGSGIGLAIALGIGWYMARHPLPLPETFYLDYLPIRIAPIPCGLIGLLGVGIAACAAWWPARMAKRLSPVEALRYE
ncbi:MAG: ABC transporter permease [Deltaproteobacteria bacterium]|nr:ABC transporter permease [Deltaproteobacteria bacterium]